MRFMHLWPLFLLILIPIVIIMYLLKQKAVNHPVPSLFLWNEMYRNKESDTPWEKLKKNKLLIIQIITILVLIFALMSPYLASTAETSENVVLLIDNSGSMNTVLSNKKTRLDYAKNAAREYVKTLSDNTAVTVIACSDRTSSLLSGSLDRSAVLNAIDSIEGTTLAGDCKGGLSICQGLAAGDAGLAVTVFTDSPISLGSLSGTIYNFAAPAENVSLDYVSSAQKNDKLNILACITNHGTSPVSGDINLYGDGELLNVMTYSSLEPGKSMVLYFDTSDFQGTVIKAEINNPDALTLDNTAYCINSAKKSGRVLLLTSRNIYLKKAIELNENITLHETNDPETFSGKAAEGYDLYIIDGQDMLPKELPSEGNLLFIHCDPGQFFEIDDNCENIYLKLENSPYTVGIEDHSFGVTDTMVVEQPMWSRSFIEADNRSAGFVGDYDNRKIGFIGFDLHNTDLPLDYRFPILIWNLISELGNSDLLPTTGITCGSSIRINAPLNDLVPSLVFPDGKTEKLNELPLLFRNTDAPGAYFLNKDNDRSEAFAVNFDTTESRYVNATVTTETTDKNTVVVDATTTVAKNYRTPVIILLLLILAFEWIVYIKD
ncbi:MAG: VWA domain-containing protein [Lachnospiraceae bacterium]|nr:VWA domain-containing protein [Lachnospiraceae bacterium]